MCLNGHPFSFVFTGSNVNVGVTKVDHLWWHSLVAVITMSYKQVFMAVMAVVSAVFGMEVVPQRT